MVRGAVGLVVCLGVVLLLAGTASASTPRGDGPLTLCAGGPGLSGAVALRGIETHPTRAVLRWKFLLWRRLVFWHRKFGLSATRRDLWTALYLMSVESGGRRLAVNGRFQGFFQFDKSTWGRGLNLFRALTNVSLFAKHTARKERAGHWQYDPWPWFHGHVPRAWQRWRR
jgi:hypothetical protein